MTDVLIPERVNPDESSSQRLGLSGYYGYRFPIATSISEGGGGHSLGLKFEMAENFQERYLFALEFGFGQTEAMLYPSDAGGTRTGSSHWAFQLGFGRGRRSYPYFTEAGDFVAALNVSTIPLLGMGSTSIDSELEGQGSETTWNVGTTHTVMGELRPWGRGPTLSPGVSLYLGTRYAGEGSEFNRFALEAMFTLQVGYGDASVRGSEEIGAMGIAQGLFTIGHSLLARYHMNKIISDPNQALSDYGLPIGGDRGSMQNLPVLEASAAFASGLGNPFEVSLRTNSGWFWGFLAMRALGGAIFLLSDGDAGKAGGLADLLGSVRLGGFAAFDMESLNERLGLSDETIERREMYINLAAFGLNTLVLLIGAAAESNPAIRGGAGANIHLGLMPDPLGGTMVERTDIGYIFVTLLSGDKSGSRAGILVHKSCHDFPSQDLQFFFSVSLLSSTLRIDNMINHPTQSEPYGDVELNTDIDAALGLEWWPTTWTRLLFGLDTKAIYGGGEGAKVGIGVMVGFDLTIPVNDKEDGSGISIGARGLFHKLFPEGAQFELVPHVGATLHF